MTMTYPVQCRALVARRTKHGGKGVWLRMIALSMMTMDHGFSGCEFSFTRKQGTVQRKFPKWETDGVAAAAALEGNK